MEGLCHPEKQTGSDKSGFPLSKWLKKLRGVPIQNKNTVKILKFGTTQTIAIIVLKIEKV